MLLYFLFNKIRKLNKSTTSKIQKKKKKKKKKYGIKDYTKH